MKLISFLLLLLFFSACQSNDGKQQAKKSAVTDLKDYQKYALFRINQADFDDQGFFCSDSFYLWSWDDFGKEFRENRITRTKSNNFYYYTFWTKLNDTITIYQEDSVHYSLFIKDTMKDINGDNLKDLIITYDTNKSTDVNHNLKIFFLDSATKKFIKYNQR
jgi:hypothetical protein